MAAATFGGALRSARETAGLSLEDISAKTRLRCTVLRDLEADCVTSSGGAVYARGHIKSICAAIGTDPSPLLALLSKQVGGEQPLPPLPVPELRRAESDSVHLPTAAKPERRGPHWAAAGVTALLVLAGLLAVGQLAEPEAPAADAAVLATETPVAVAPKAQPTAKKPAAAKPAPNGAQLRLRLRGDSWVSVKAGPRTLYEGVLRDGAVREFKDPVSLRLVVGNAGAVLLGCGGRDLGPAGREGAVHRFLCTAKGIAPA